MEMLELLMGVMDMEVDKVTDEVANMEIDWQVDWLLMQEASPCGQISNFLTIAICATRNFQLMQE